MPNFANTEISCGVKQMYGLSRDPKVDLEAFITSIKPFRAFIAGAFIIFSDVVGQRGDNFMHYINNNKEVSKYLLVEKGPEHVNPNSGNIIAIYIMQIHNLVEFKEWIYSREGTEEELKQYFLLASRAYNQPITSFSELSLSAC